MREDEQAINMIKQARKFKMGGVEQLFFIEDEKFICFYNFVTAALHRNKKKLNLTVH